MCQSFVNRTNVKNCQLDLSRYFISRKRFFSRKYSCGRLIIEVDKMNDIMELLTSKEIIVVYIVVGIACLLGFIIYMVDKSYYKRKRKQNTKELNKLVENVQERINEEVPKESEAVLSKIGESTQNILYVDPPVIPKEPEIVPLNVAVPTKVAAAPVIEEDLPKVTPLQVVPTQPVKERPVEREVEVNNSNNASSLVLEQMREEPAPTLTYTTIEPDPKEAQAQLQKLTEELEKAEEVTKNIELTSFEEEQEENAIISLDEFMKKGKAMVAQNEVTQYKDEGNEPISLADLERRKQEVYREKVEVPVQTVNKQTVEKKKMVLDDFNTVSIPEEQNVNKTKKFHNSPVISPVYGIEKEANSNDLELENTARYEQLDEEIRKTNKFLVTLKELQKKLD